MKTLFAIMLAVLQTGNMLVFGEQSHDVSWGDNIENTAVRPG